MKLFYYVHTGHRIGLDRFRRATTIIRSLGDVDITLLCSDFRIAHEAKHFGVKTSVGLDVVRNIPHIAHHGDKIIFDSDEANPIMLKDMKQFFSTFIHLNENDIYVDEKYFEQTKKTKKLGFFFGDDDYSKDLEKNLMFLQELNPDLLLGFYFFFDYEDMLKEKFKNNHEFEDYDDFITSCEVLLTSSYQATLECLASGGKPIYIQRNDYSEDFLEKLKELNIPIIMNYNKKEILETIKLINKHKYSKLKQNCNKLVNLIKENLISK
jgi:hypothetical protein